MAGYKEFYDLLVRYSCGNILRCVVVLSRARLTPRIGLLLQFLLEDSQMRLIFQWVCPRAPSCGLIAK